MVIEYIYIKKLNFKINHYNISFISISSFNYDVTGPLMCDIYAMIGSLCGGASIWTMSFIALDRYNVIVKGMAGTPLTIPRVLLQILVIWLFALLWTILPMVGWNRYVPEGNMTSCGTDFLTQTWSSKSYILVYSIFVYYSPLFTIIYSYWFIVTVSN